MAKKLAANSSRPSPILLHAEMPRGGQYCSHLHFSPDSRRLVACGNDRKIHLYDVTSSQRVASVQEHSGTIDGVAFTPDSLRFATLAQRTHKRKTAGGELFFWRADDGKLLKRLAIVPAIEDVEFLSLLFTPDGNYLVCVIDDGEASLLAVLDSATGKQTSSFAIETTGPIALSPAGKALAVAADGEVLLLDFPSGKLRKALKLNGRVRAIDFSSDGKVVAAVDKDHATHLFSATSGKSLAMLSESMLDVQLVQFSKGGGLIATIGVTIHGGSAAPIRIWELKSNKVVAAFPGSTGIEYPGGFPGSCALSADFQLFANAGTKTRLWQVSL